MNRERKLSKELAKEQFKIVKATQGRPARPNERAFLENNGTDMNLVSLFQILGRAESALAVEGAPREQLIAIQNKARICRDEIMRIRDLRRRAEKKRKPVLEFYRGIEQDINNLSNQTGFDLLDEETWTQDRCDTPN